MNPKVSIIIPFFNVEHYIEKCVKSVLAQKLNNVELIFVNDYSADNSLALLHAVLEQNKSSNFSVKIINHDKNRGIAAARNTGLQAATGQYIGWVDSDDWIEENMFKELYEEAISVNAELVWCDFCIKTDKESLIVIQKHPLKSIPLIKSSLPGRQKGTLWNKLIKKSLFDDNNISFVEGMDTGEDIRALVQLYTFAKKYAYINQPLYLYNKTRKESIMYKAFHQDEINHAWLNNIKGIEQFLKSNGILEANTELQMLKLGAKHNVLVRARNMNKFMEWAKIFPETNSFIWQQKIPLYYKILGWAIIQKVNFIPKAWLSIRAYKKDPQTKRN